MIFYFTPFLPVRAFPMKKAAFIIHSVYDENNKQENNSMHEKIASIKSMRYEEGMQNFPSNNQTISRKRFYKWYFPYMRWGLLFIFLFYSGFTTCECRVSKLSHDERKSMWTSCNLSMLKRVFLLKCNHSTEKWKRTDLSSVIIYKSSNKSLLIVRVYKH